MNTNHLLSHPSFSFCLRERKNMLKKILMGEEVLVLLWLGSFKIKLGNWEHIGKVIIITYTISYT
jgi:hypothetical protein